MDWDWEQPFENRYETLFQDIHATCGHRPIIPAGKSTTSYSMGLFRGNLLKVDAL